MLREGDGSSLFKYFESSIEVESESIIVSWGVGGCWVTIHF